MYSTITVVYGTVYFQLDAHEYQIVSEYLFYTHSTETRVFDDFIDVFNILMVSHEFTCIHSGLYSSIYY